MKKIHFLLCFIITVFFSAESFASNVILNDKIAETQSFTASTSASAITAKLETSKHLVCQGDAQPTITFTALSGGNSPYTFYYTLNGVSNIVNSNPGSNSKSIEIPTNNPAKFIVSLDSVSSGGLPADKQENQKDSIVVAELPYATFTFNDNVCSGEDVIFNVQIDYPDKYYFLWEFGDNITSNETNPTHTYFAIGNGTQLFTIKLTVTNKLTNCSSVVTHDVIIKKGADTGILSSATLTDYNGYKTFSLCENATKQIVFTNNSTTKDTDSHYVIDFGDGSSVFSSDTWTSISHTYTPGLWSLKYTVSTLGGCDVTRIYKVFVGSNPSVSLGNPGNTDVCSGTTLSFPITNIGNNPPGTTYTVFFNDGSSPQIFNHPPPSEVTHTFTRTSCGVTSSNGTSYFENSFSATLVAENPCGKSSVNVVPIYVTTPPKADIKAIKSIGCVNEKMFISYPDTLSTMAGPRGCVGSKVVWTITPNQNYVLNGSQLGNDNGSDNYNLWQSGSYVITPTFTAPGIYIIKVKTGNKCATDEATDTICITSSPEPTFSVDKTVGCFPLTVNTNNTTVETNNCGNKMDYRWQIISYKQGTCGTSSSYTMTDGANVVSNGFSASKNTRIVFNNPGIYTLRLAATNNCGTNYSSTLQTITVNGPPKVAIDAISNLCQTLPETTIKPSAQYVNCGSEALTYEWSFPGGNPATSSSEVPGNVTYSTYGIYTVSLKVTNECGISETSTRTFTIKPQPIITNTLENQIKCAGQMADKIHFEGNVDNIVYHWTNNNTQIGLPANGIGDILPFALKNSGSSTITATITVTPELNGCEGTPQKINITVKPSVYFTSQPASSTVCLNDAPEILSVVYTNGEGTPSYQWYSNTENNNITGTIIPAAKNATYVPPTNTIGTIYYYCVLTLSDNVCGPIVSNVAFVTVSDYPTVDAGPLTTQKICVGGTIQPLLVTIKDGAGTPSYQWFSNVTNVNSGGVIIPGANFADYTPPVFNTVGNYYFYVVINYPESTCGTVVSPVAEVVVTPDPVITTQPIAAQSVCQNTLAASLLVVATGEAGDFMYQWYQNTTNSNVNGRIINGAITDTYIPPTDIVGTTYYYCIVSQSGLNCAVTSETAEVKVTLGPVITSQPQPATICLGDKLSQLSVSYKDGVGAPLYQWYANAVNDNSTGTVIVGATNSTFLPPSAEAGIVYYYCVITIPSGGCSTLVSNAAKITIFQYPVISDYAVHIGSGMSFTVAPSVLSFPADTIPAGTTYTWTEPIVLPSGTITGASAEAHPQSQISQFLTNISKNTATVTYTVTPVANGCIGKPFQIVVTVDPPLKANVVQTNITCFGANNGALVLEIVGGTPPYTVNWNGPDGFTSASTSISGLIPGDYVLKITDSQGIVSTQTYTITEPTELTLKTTSEKDVTCFGAENGEILIFVSGGTLPYKYIWLKDGNPFATTSDISNLSPGEYSVTVTDANDCHPQTANYTITEPKVLSVTLLEKSYLKCFGDSTGYIQIEVEGGTPRKISAGVFDYDYKWTGPNGFTSNNKNISNLKAGDYTLEVVDSMGCTEKLQATIYQSSEIKISVTEKPVSCYGSNDGTIEIKISGGVEPYLIEWNNFAKGTYLEDLGPGTYTVTVTDANFCQVSKSIVIEETQFSIHPIVKNVTCNGAQDGSISLNVIGGVPPVTLIWDDNVNAGSTRNRLNAGTYTVHLSDASCSFTKSFTILEPLPMDATSTIKDAFDCDNPNSGSISLVVSGGTEPYSFVWSNGKTSKDLTDIPAGTYILNITDKNGCALTKQYEIKRPQPLNMTVNVVPDYHCESGELKMICSAQVTGGMPPYQYLWSNDAGNSGSDKMVYSQSGIFLLTITDHLGCSTSKTFELNIPIIGIDYQMIECNDKTYRFDAMIPYGQSSDYAYLWNFGDNQTSTLQHAEHKYTLAGTYQVTLKITNGTCETTFVRNVEIIDKPVLLLNKIPVFCPGDSILLHVSGAKSYRWFDGSTSDSILIKNSGDYTVEGTNKYGCSSVLYFSAKNFDSYGFTIQTDKNEVSEHNAQVSFSTDYLPDAEYYWDFGDENFGSGYSPSHTYNVDRSGFYDVKLTVKNPDGCIENAVKRIWIINTELKNTFTPNGDGVDDIFMKGWNIKIYNRNGVLMYEGMDGWDGTYKGKEANNDTYFVVLYYSTEKGIKTNTGFITVIR